MFLCTSLLRLILLTYVTCGSSALYTPSKNNDTVPTGCYGTIDFGTGFLRNTFITFHYDKERDYQFAIKSPYHIYYPKAIRSALQLGMFQLYSLKSDQKCGWQKARSVHSTAWTQVGKHRGDIYWKYSDLRWIEYPENSTLVPHWSATHEDHIPPRNGLLPHEQTLDRISRILLDNVPAGDVFEISTICLGYSCGFLIVVLFTILIHRWTHIKPKPQEDENPEAVELTAITQKSTEKLPSSDQSRSATDEFDCFYPFTRNSIQREQSDPLPLYSVDGTGA